MIDRFREQIPQRLAQAAREADRLRKALAALEPSAGDQADGSRSGEREVQKAQLGYRLSPDAPGY